MTLIVLLEFSFYLLVCLLIGQLLPYIATHTFLSEQRSIELYIFIVFCVFVIGMAIIVCHNSQVQIQRVTA